MVKRVIFRVVAPVLVNVMVCAKLEMLIGWLEKTRVVGESVPVAVVASGEAEAAPERITD